MFYSELVCKNLGDLLYLVFKLLWKNLGSPLCLIFEVVRKNLGHPMDFVFEVVWKNLRNLFCFVLEAINFQILETVWVWNIVLPYSVNFTKIRFANKCLLLLWKRHDLAIEARLSQHNFTLKKTQHKSNDIGSIPMFQTLRKTIIEKRGSTNNWVKHGNTNDRQWICVKNRQQ